MVKFTVVFAARGEGGGSGRCHVVHVAAHGFNKLEWSDWSCELNCSRQSQTGIKRLGSSLSWQLKRGAGGAKSVQVWSQDKPEYKITGTSYRIT